MMISKAAAVAAAVAASADGSVASVQDVNMPTVASAAVGGEQSKPKPKPKPKLTLEQKRELVMTWFTSQDVRIKDLPHGKAFVRRAARDLQLGQLRKLRRSSSTDEVHKINIDGMARRRVMAYHPRQFAAVQRREQKNNNSSTGAAAEEKSIVTISSLGRDQIRSILLAFYGSTGRDAVPLGRHLRNYGVLAQKPDILAIVRSIGLRRMKRDGVSIEEAAAKLDEVLATVSFAGQKKADNNSVVDCADHLDAMQIDVEATSTSPVIDTKAKRQAVRIAERRSQRKIQRQAMVEAKRAARILKKQQQQQQTDAHKAAQKQLKQQQLPDKALAIIQSNPSLLKLVQTSDTQDLLMEWYVDQSKPSIVDFLASKDEANGDDDGGNDDSSSLLDTYKRPLRLLVKAGQLQRLRKAGAGRDKAAKALQDVLARASTKKGAVVAKVSLQKNPNATSALAGVKQDDLQRHLMQWFQDDSMSSVVDYLAANELPPGLRPAMAQMIKHLGLRQLRKDRRMASVQARRRINGALKGSGKAGLQRKGKKKNTTDGDVPTISAILPSAPAADLLEDEDEYVSVSKGGDEMADDAPLSYVDAIASEDKADLDQDFVVLH